MGCPPNAIFSLLILVISTSSELPLFSIAHGRRLAEMTDDSKTGILRGQLGSRPPWCNRRCASCGQCEAIQVPTNSTTAAVIAYVRGDGNSNYKPMSWKCKCGNLIFNP